MQEPHLDLRGTPCPLNYVRARLAVEKLPAGGHLLLDLDAGEPERMVHEALRGEGAVLRLPDGTPFMERHDPRKELAPRDIVARAIDFEMKRGGFEHVLLDISHKPADWLRQRFPTIHESCKRWGYDLTAEPIPVVPSAHFMCGGITTDLHGRTTIPGLSAIGECAFHDRAAASKIVNRSLFKHDGPKPECNIPDVVDAQCRAIEPNRCVLGGVIR